MSGQISRQFQPQSAILNKKQVAMRIGRSVPTFNRLRPELEQRGFPKYDGLLRGWLVMAVEAWINKRANVPNEDELEEQIAMARIYENT